MSPSRPSKFKSTTSYNNSVVNRRSGALQVIDLCEARNVWWCSRMWPLLILKAMERTPIARVYDHLRALPASRSNKLICQWGWLAVRNRRRERRKYVPQAHGKASQHKQRSDRRRRCRCVWSHAQYTLSSLDQEAKNAVIQPLSNQPIRPFLDNNHYLQLISLNQ